MQSALVSARLQGSPQEILYSLPANVDKHTEYNFRDSFYCSIPKNDKIVCSYLFLEYVGKRLIAVFDTTLRFREDEKI